MKYNIFNYNGEREIFIKTLDDTECDIQAEIRELNKEVSEEDSIHGLGYFARKQEVFE